MNHRHADFQSSVIQAISVPCSEKSVKPDTEDQSLKTDLSNVSSAVVDAARWLSLHRDECVGRIVPTLKEHFGLRAIEAVQAMVMAREGGHA
ncbi:hypothetical protein JVX98_19280 [Ensifer sp. PDNC004]|uniref:hypothetical protein n=1 Tax=Ensifer sp. PDNC004 TaxID=2811423 RepID=UPI001964E06F|nr:hypothetical protein [Ensifer sp. PDNC004]QRY66540.1 hypothetical protein JVX98_19280 [Ensifer sp. PDNC004]